MKHARIALTTFAIGLLLSISQAENTLVQLKDWQSQIAYDFTNLYAPFAEKTGRHFEFVWRMDDPLEIATIATDGKKLQVIVSGGFLKSPRLSPDGFRLTLCHEMGHLLGGLPRRDPPVDWEGTAESAALSSEGQADYYASFVCFRRLVQGQDHAGALKGVEVPRELRAPCEKVWGENSEGALVCERAAAGGWNLLQLVKEFPISFATPDSSVAAGVVKNSYPTRQCRLDTILAGALCKTAGSLELDTRDASKNDCAAIQAQRPDCWYPHGEGR